MQIIPAIDIKSGKCVRLYQGNFEQITEYEENPWAVANNYVKAGAKQLHIVDLDGAKIGEPVQTSHIAHLCQIKEVQIQIGGGIRSHRHIKVLFDNGAARVVIGSMAVTCPAQVKTWIREFGPERIVLAFDVIINNKNEPIVQTQGWQTEAKQNMWELISFYQDVSLKNVLCTDISKDGTLQGPNLDLYQQCVEKFPNIAFQASGGIGTIQDIEALTKLNVFAAIVGKALYEKRFTLQEVLDEVTPC